MSLLPLPERKKLTRLYGSYPSAFGKMAVKFKTAIKAAAPFAALTILLTVSPLSAWGEHYLLTARAIEAPGMQWTAEEVRPKPLGEFVQANRSQLAGLFKDYYSWLDDKMDRSFPESYKQKPFDPQRVTDTDSGRHEFVKAARLHPKTRFFLVTRLLPGQKHRRPAVKPTDISPFLPVSERFFTAFDDSAGTKVSLASVIYTFADEPDWQMDNNMWDHKEYGYGKIPYGKKTGVSSRAPFHMQFKDEPWLFSLFAPGLSEGMVQDRVELFTHMARLAWRQGEHYWAARFSAWAIHYLQDMCQPYHARLMPSSGMGDYMKYIFTWDKDAYKKRMLQVLGNRHFAYEGFIAWVLSRSYSHGDRDSLALAAALKQPGSYQTSGTLPALFESTVEWSVDNAEEVDRVIVDQWGAVLHREDFFILKDKSGILDKELARMKLFNNPLIETTKQNFRRAGNVTRNVLELIRPPGQQTN